MKKWMILLIFFPLFCFSQRPDTSKKIYFFYDEGKVLKPNGDLKDVNVRNNGLIIFSVSRQIREEDNTLVGTHALFSLFHFEGDDIFVKHKRYLDIVSYFDSRWLENTSNIEGFWGRTYYGPGKPDPLRIYKIENIENSDSLLFLRVHRNVLRD